MPNVSLKACWREPKLSDIELRIIEKPAPLPRDAEVQPSKKARTYDRGEPKHIIPWSKSVLAVQSEYFKACLLSDLEDGAKEVPFVVEEGEADAALAVIQTMYTGLPEDVTPAKLIMMWKIADRLQATCAALCVEALCAMELDWETAMMVFHMPSTVLEPTSPFAPVAEAAANRVVADLGDLEVTMQPDSCTLQKLAELPQPALEALLDSEELEVASENAAIAAVTYWLDQEGRAEQLTTGEKQRLAYKLRLLRATPWYLTRVLGDEQHWLSGVLSTGQRIMLSSAAHTIDDWTYMETKARTGLNAKLFGEAEAPVVSWSKEPRRTVSIWNSEMLLEVSLKELWDKRDVAGFVDSPGVFYNGNIWSLQVCMGWLAGSGGTGGDSEVAAGFTLGVFIHHGVVNQPMALSLKTYLEGAGYMRAPSRRKRPGRCFVPHW